MAQTRIIIVGAGFGGLAAAKALSKAPAEIILIDRTNLHLYSHPVTNGTAIRGSGERVELPSYWHLRKPGHES